MDVLSLGKANQVLRKIKDLNDTVLAPLAESRFPTVDARLDWLEGQANQLKVQRISQVDLSKGTFDNTELVNGKIQLKMIQTGQYAVSGTYETPILDLGEDWFETKLVDIVKQIHTGSTDCVLKIASSTDGITFASYVSFDPLVLVQARYIKIQASLSATPPAPIYTNVMIAVSNGSSSGITSSITTTFGDAIQFSKDIQLSAIYAFMYNGTTYKPAIYESGKTVNLASGISISSTSNSVQKLILDTPVILKANITYFIGVCAVTNSGTCNFPFASDSTVKTIGSATGTLKSTFGSMTNTQGFIFYARADSAPNTYMGWNTTSAVFIKFDAIPVEDLNPPATYETPTLDSITITFDELTIEGRLKDLEQLNAINLAKLQFKSNSLLQSDKYALHDLIVDTFETATTVETTNATYNATNKEFAYDTSDTAPAVQEIILPTETMPTYRKKFILNVDHAGNIDYEFSLDGGATWNPVTPFTIIDVTGQVGTNLKVKAKLKDSTAKLRGIAFSWA